MAVPTDQWLDTYGFFSDFTYDSSSIFITRRKVRSSFRDVTLDCAGALTGWKPITEDYEWSYAELTRFGEPQTYPGGTCTDGAHRIVSDGAVLDHGLGDVERRELRVSGRHGAPAHLGRARARALRSSSRRLGRDDRAARRRGGDGERDGRLPRRGLEREARQWAHPETDDLIAESVEAGSKRVRSLLMTVLSNIFGLLPILLGADVAKRIAGRCGRARLADA